jgi:hypothetical protein
LPSESYTVIVVEKFAVLAGFCASQGLAATAGGPTMAAVLMAVAAESRLAVTIADSVARAGKAAVGAVTSETEAAKVPSPLAA